MKLNFISSVIAGTALLLSLGACNDDDNGGTVVTPPSTGYFTNFATFVSSSNTGSVFEIQEKTGSPVVQVTASQQIAPGALDPGSRCMITYAPQSGSEFSGGPATLSAVLSVFQGAPKVGTASEYSNFQGADCFSFLVSPVLPYINIGCEATLHAGEKIDLFLVADSETVGDEFPHVYVYLKARADALSSPKQRFYGSFDVSSILNAQNAKGLILHYRNAVGTETTLTVNKSGITPVDPTPNPGDE